MKKNTLLLSLLFILSANLFAQETEPRTTEQVDSIMTTLFDSTYTASDSLGAKAYRNAPADTSAVEQRSFSKSKLDELRKDPSMQYEQPSTVGESLMERFWQWLAQLLQSILKASVTTNWGRVLTWAIAIAVIVIIIFMVLKVNAFNMLLGGRRAAPVGHNVFDENIHEMDFEKLIQEAISQDDYRRGVRLVFLYSLKLLADKQLIHWEQGKTNHDYVAELKAGDLKNGLYDLSYYFDYAWYGNFAINRELFSKVNDIFTTWKTNLR